MKFLLTCLLVLFTTVIGQADIKTAYSNEPNSEGKLQGIASYYANFFVGKKTANGEIFSQKKLTAACNILPLGTLVTVTNLNNGKSVTVKINDRLHHRNKRIVDLSYAAAKELDMVKSGLAKVSVEVVSYPNLDPANLLEDTISQEVPERDMIQDMFWQ